MSALLSTFIVGISLSMDAFSLALVYGTVGLRGKQEVLLAVIVSIYHFIMPLLGLCFGEIITSKFFINVNFLVTVIFGIIGISMIMSSVKKRDDSIIISFWGFLLFGLSVSIDSFTTGIGLKIVNDNYLEVSFIFAMVSGIFTYLGLKLGGFLSDSFGRYSTFGGGVMLIVLGIYYLF